MFQYVASVAEFALPPILKVSAPTYSVGEVPSVFIFNNVFAR
jgi:hypothetical protein